MIPRDLFLNFILKISPTALKMGPKVIYLKLIALRLSVLGQSFKDIGQKLPFLKGI